MAEFLSKVFVGVVVWAVSELIKKATYHIKAKMKAKKNDAPTNDHRS